ncbi:MAG: class 1 fructose-bisphosphatase [Planctomycetes bacterium]|nr:class 1 fructose-bisphosphatase [Planctomycetota bacterium]
MQRHTLVEQFVHDQAKVPGATGELSRLLSRLSLAGRMIAMEIMRAGFVGRLGLTGDKNVQDEEVRALDVLSNDIFIRVFETVDTVSSIASEEMSDVYYYSGERTGKYVLVFDPLDGSSNVDANGAMGSIFSIHRRCTDGPRATLADFLQPGSEQVAAGYILYGPATMFVYTSGGPVNGFTLDRAIGEFFLTHPGMRIPEGTGSYAVNEANEAKWDERTRAMVQRFRLGQTACGKRSARYVGALVADFHRTLVQGGIYMYPGEAKRKNGKLRLLYEGAPLAMVARQAGGHATDGERPILEVEPAELHQRTPLYIGSRADVEEATRLLRG